MSLSFPYFVVSMVTLQGEMFLIWKYVNRKSDLFITAVDLINRDTVILHNVMSSFVSALFYLVSFVHDEFKLWSIPAFILAGTFQVITSMTLVYYSLGITLRYVFIRNQSMEFGDNWTDNDIRMAARIFSFIIAITLFTLHMSFGGEPRFYHDLTGQVAIKGRDVVAIIIPVTLLLKRSR